MEWKVSDFYREDEAKRTSANIRLIHTHKHLQAQIERERERMRLSESEWVESEAMQWMLCLDGCQLGYQQPT